MTRHAQFEILRLEGQLWNVDAIDAVLGMGKNLGQVRAISRAEAEQLAAEQFGAGHYVSLAGGRARRDRDEHPRRFRGSR